LKLALFDKKHPARKLFFFGDWGKIFNENPRGGGVYSMKFYMGRLHPEVQPLTLSYTNFYRNGTPFIYLEENCTPFLYLKDKPKQ